MTITDRSIAQTLLANKGVFPGDPQMVRIYSYIGEGGEKAYACFQRIGDDDMISSPYVAQARILMVNGVLTPSGQRELDELNLLIHNSKL